MRQQHLKLFPLELDEFLKDLINQPQSLSGLQKMANGNGKMWTHMLEK